MIGSIYFCQAKYRYREFSKIQKPNNDNNSIILKTMTRILSYELTETLPIGWQYKDAKSNKQKSR